MVNQAWICEHPVHGVTYAKTEYDSRSQQLAEDMALTSSLDDSIGVDLSRWTDIEYCKVLEHISDLYIYLDTKRGQLVMQPMMIVYPALYNVKHTYRA